jgi:hypothetical protein
MASNISSRGTIENFLHQGITPQDGLMEIVDNEIDAGATKVVTRIDTETRTLTVSGDGKGMNKDGMIKGLRINNTRPASDAIGLRGVGGKAGLAVLSGLEYSGLTVSQMEGEKVYEVEIDWPRTMREDQWAPTPSPLTCDTRPMWEAARINPEHGTVVRVTMPKAVLDKLVPGLGAELARVYEPRINHGVDLQLVIDGKEVPLSTERVLGYVDAEHKQEVRVRLMRNPETKEERAYSQREYRKKKVWSRKGEGRTLLRDVSHAEEAGFVCTGEFTLLSAHDKKWGNNDDGYLSPCRNGRFLGAIPTRLRSQGDYWARNILANSRHGLLFAQENDNDIGVQVNKTAVSREHMNMALREEVEHVMWEFATRVANNVKPQPIHPPAEEAQRKKDWKMLKDFEAKHEGFLAAMKVMMEDWVDEEEDEEEN